MHFESEPFFYETFYTNSVLFCLFSCSSTKINPLEYKENKIFFGSGGGIAGIEKSHVLLNNGSIYALTKMNQEYKFDRKLKRNETIQIFKNYKMLNFDSLELNSPGNTYKFIQFSIDGNVNRISWPSNENVGKASIMHAILMNTIKD